MTGTPEPPEGRLRMRIVVRGRVQGVGFRYAAVREARRLGLSGWARNTPDGCVEVVAEGDGARVRELIAWCRTGPPVAQVTGVQHHGVSAGEPLSGFDIRW
jgi:acylphosphatase